MIAMPMTAQRVCRAGFLRVTVCFSLIHSSLLLLAVCVPLPLLSDGELEPR